MQIWTVRAELFQTDTQKATNGAIYSQLNWAILLCDVIPDGKKTTQILVTKYGKVTFMLFISLPRGASPPNGPGTFQWGFMITLRYTTLGSTPLDTQHSRQKSMPPVGFESAIPASERPQTATMGVIHPQLNREILLCGIITDGKTE